MAEKKADEPAIGADKKWGWKKSPDTRANPKDSRWKWLIIIFIIWLVGALVINSYTKDCRIIDSQEISEIEEIRWSIVRMDTETAFFICTQELLRAIETAQVSTERKEIVIKHYGCLIQAIKKITAKEICCNR